MKAKEKYYKIKHLLPEIIQNLGDAIEKKAASGVESFWYSGLQYALDSELKCEVRSTQIDAEMAFIVADYFGLRGSHYDRLEPLHMSIKRQKLGSILDRVKEKK